MTEILVYPEQFPEAFTPRLIIEVPNANDVAGFEDEIAHLIDPHYEESQWAARVALMRLLQPKHFQGPLAKISFSVMPEPLARLAHAQARGSGVRFYSDAGNPAYNRRDYVKDFDQMHMDKLIGMTMHAAACSGGAELCPVELDVWYAKEAVNKKNRDLETGVKRVVTTPRYDEKFFKNRLDASKQRGTSISQGVAGKSDTRAPVIDSRG